MRSLTVAEWVIASEAKQSRSLQLADKSRLLRREAPRNERKKYQFCETIYILTEK